MDCDLNLFNSISDNDESLTNEHYKGRSYEDRPIPINECMCSCYKRRWFELGRKSERNLFHGSDRKTHIPTAKH